MVSPELIRRYPFFGGLTPKQTEVLARAGDERRVDAGQYFFHEGELVSRLWLVLEGAVAVVMELPNREKPHSVADQLTGKLRTRDVVISTVGPGHVFGWSALVPPYGATASTKSMTDVLVVEFDAESLRECFDEDCAFGYVMMQKIAQVTRDRLHDTRIQSLPFYAAE
jgi:CRP/FNR family cyclic AMP-dependent transcriptional regulator